MGKKHAEHNELLCDHLIATTGFNDWVITTAFYSSLHFVLNKIFPLTIQGKIYKNIDHYCIIWAKSSAQSKHKTIISLVSIYIDSIQSEYRWLYNACMTARYHNYIISDKMASSARTKLTKIKSKC